MTATTWDICRTCLTSVEVESCKNLSSPLEEDLQPLNTIGDALKDLIKNIVRYKSFTNFSEPFFRILEFGNN